ncbi:ArsR/SmtB family transcription factor [Hypericibacter sp.]|uniref:ArsR/SmtB family transcription factor n=1 Tax=Hypericibacter sp. TaxID=2705401 RepID=UPI003D6DA0A5
MVEQQTAPLDTLFRALADPTRRAMLRSLSEGEHSVGELAAPFRMSFAAASKHVKVLEHAGLVRRTVKGRSHLCRLDPQPLAAADEWLRFYEQFWRNSLDALAEALSQPDLDSKRDPDPKNPGGKNE